MGFGIAKTAPNSGIAECRRVKSGHQERDDVLLSDCSLHIFSISQIAGPSWCKAASCRTCVRFLESILRRSSPISVKLQVATAAMFLKATQRLMLKLRRIECFERCPPHDSMLWHGICLHAHRGAEALFLEQVKEGEEEEEEAVEVGYAHVSNQPRSRCPSRHRGYLG